MGMGWGRGGDGGRWGGCIDPKRIDREDRKRGREAGGQGAEEVDGVGMEEDGK